MVIHKLQAVKLLILDVDGVLTDGSVIYSDNGFETKAFNVKDGLGIKFLMEAGIIICIATGRRSQALRHRCKDLGIVHIFEGIKDKAAVMESILDRTGVSAEEAACIGDDLPDLPMMKQVGLSIAVADAHEIVINTADMKTSANGGAGAVREIAEAILKAQGRWEPILERFV